MRKRLIALAALALISTTGCDSNGWIGSTIKNIELTPVIRGALEKAGVIDAESPRGAYADRSSRTVLFDEICEDDGHSINCPNMVDTEFWRKHEYGHILYDDIGQPFGNTFVAHEHGANCIAEVLTGRNPPFTDDANGYVDCTATEVNQTRRRMVNAGIADEQRSKL